MRHKRPPGEARLGVACLVVALWCTGLVAGPVRAADSSETPCVACRLWDRAMARVPEEAVAITGEAVPSGVVLRVTAADPQISQVLWSVSCQRQRLLEQLHRGAGVPLCPDCQANVEAFDALRIDIQRLPDGVLLLYTSTDAAIVHRLHDLVTATSMPL